MGINRKIITRIESKYIHVKTNTKCVIIPAK